MKRSIRNFKSLFIGLGLLFSGTISAFTAVSSGDWTSTATWGGAAPSTTVINQNIIIPSGITVNLNADIYFSGALFNFTVDGILTNTTTNSIYMLQGNFGGGGTVGVNKVSFQLLSISTFSGNLNVKELHNSVTSLAFTALANVSDTLNLEDGNLILNLNGNLNISNNATVKINSGSLSLNLGVFNSSNNYNVMYVGNSKTAGIELNTLTLQNLRLSFSSATQSLTLMNNTAVNGDLDITSGKLSLNGKKLSLNGNLTMGSGAALSSNTLSELYIAGTGSLTSVLVFDVPSIIKDLTINRASTGLVKLSSTLTIANHLNLMEGNFSLELGGSLIAANNSTIHVEKGFVSSNGGAFNGSAAYNVEYMGSGSAIAGLELTGSGLNNVTVDYAAASNKATITNNTAIAGKLAMNTGLLDLNGRNLTLNGTLSQNAFASFIGNTASELILNLNSVTNDTLFFDASGSNSQALSQLKINIGGSSDIVLGSKLTIGNALTFVKGKLELGNNDLTILPAASIVGYDNSKYIVSSNGTGALVMNVVAGSQFVTFPIGLTSNYSPASIQQSTSAASGNFSARVVASPVTAIKVVNRIWMIESSATTIDANLKLGWMAAAEINGFDRTNAYVSHYMNSVWDVIASTSATVAANTTFELARTGITSLSPFMVTQTGQHLGLKANVIANEIVLFPNPSKYIVNISMTTTSDQYRYSLVDLSGRTILMTTENGRSATLDVSKLETGFYFIRASNLSDGTVIMKRFIKE